MHKYNMQKEMEVSIKAGNFVGTLYNALLKQYKDPTNGHSLKSLNKLCVRLVFLLYAEDAGIFQGHCKFQGYIKAKAAKDIKKVGRSLIDLFKVLNTEIDKRDPYLDEDLASFPYVNGGLFADEDIEIPNFTQDIVYILLKKAGEDFNWSHISPTIFGAVFESTLNPVTRSQNGMHYTSIENIHKLIDPLFLDHLKEELNTIKANKVTGKGKNSRDYQLKAFQNKLAGLTFLDPACGSGNFLTETYLSIRRLENDVIATLAGDQAEMGTEDFNPVKVSIFQFYGIEINDFAVTVAKTALWIAESQMLNETQLIINTALDFLPLKSYSNIVKGNALRINWEDVVEKSKLSFILGNPPFIGARIMSSEQKADLNEIFQGWKNAGDLDYVSCWYKKSADLIKNTTVKAALVSTNSVSQGQSVANLWKPLFESGIHIDFAHRTFPWDSQAGIKAHVHCVIIGYSFQKDKTKIKDKYIFDKGTVLKADNINGYLLDADNVFVESRKKPICNVPEIKIGNKPIDNGYYLFSKEEMEAFINKEPGSKKYFRPWYGSFEFINRKPRYCLWLGHCTPGEIQKMPQCQKLVEKVREYRLKSPSPGTRKIALTPTRFHVENMQNSNYIVIPETSSEKRTYVPMGFMTPYALCSNAVRLIHKASLYHFGILTSKVHMAWMRAVGGRLEMRYRYSVDIVYNNFPWPNPTFEQKAKIEKTAQAILDARELYPDSTLADLYHRLTMPEQLRKAHNNNDKCVMEAYGFDVALDTEPKILAKLIRMYQKLTGSTDK